MSGYKLDNEQIQEIETVFCFFDKDKDGVLNLRDATNALRSLGKDPTDAQIKETLKNVNSGNIQEIDFAAFIQLAAAEINSSEGISISGVQDAFSVFDKHENGEISAIELRNVMCNLGDQMTDDEANFLFREAGINPSSLLDYRQLIDSMKNTLKQ